MEKDLKPQIHQQLMAEIEQEVNQGGEIEKRIREKLQLEFDKK